MLKQLYIYIQYSLPQHLLSRLIGAVADTRIGWLKNFLIYTFIKIYKIDLSTAEIEDPREYPTFNSFFIRHLKPNLRPIDLNERTIICPVDGTISQIGQIDKERLLQAKNFYFDLKSLFADDLELVTAFEDGSFSTLYLAPNNYHRVHMPFAGKLRKTIYVPGKLFSVNQTTSYGVPNLYSRNERLISIFETKAGTMVVILVGAMIVGSIQTVWMEKPIREQQIKIEAFADGIYLNKGAELGYFKMGSTVIVLFQKNKIEWLTTLNANSQVHFGQILGNLLK